MGKTRLYTFILDDTGRPVPMADGDVWWQWLNDSIEKRRVKVDRVQGGTTIIVTSFIGSAEGTEEDYQAHRLLLWQTLVTGAIRNGAAVRYASREEALAGHVRMLNVISLIASKLQLNGQGPGTWQ